MKRITKSSIDTAQSVSSFACQTVSCGATCEGCRSGDTAAALMNEAQKKSWTMNNYIYAQNKN